MVYIIREKRICVASWGKRPFSHGFNVFNICRFFCLFTVSSSCSGRGAKELLFSMFKIVYIIRERQICVASFRVKVLSIMVSMCLTFVGFFLVV